MLQKVKDYIQKMHMIQPKDMVYVALSGGADSVCLFYILKELSQEMDFQLAAIHVEHGIRGEESLWDAHFVQELCRKKEVTLEEVKVDALCYSKEHKMGLEEAARILRYEAFERIGKGAKVAVAHHLNDQAETMLFQMMRGTGITGLRGLLPVRTKEGVTYIRPLLSCSRKEVEAFLLEKDLSYCTDSTNSCLDYSRNRIRHTVIPELEKINEKALFHMGSLSEKLAEADGYLSGMIEETFVKCVQKEADGTFLCLKEFENLHPYLQKEVLLKLIESACGKSKDITTAHISALLELTGLQSGKRVMLPYNLEAVKEFDRLRVGARKEKKEDYETAVGTLKLGEKRWVDLKEQGKLSFELVRFDGNVEKIPQNPYTIWMDYDKIEGNLCVRNRRQRDYLTIDTNGQRKKLKEYLIEQKIPVEERNRIPLVALRQEVLWIPGRRGSENYRIGEHTEYILIMTYNGGNSHGHDKTQY